MNDGILFEPYQFPQKRPQWCGCKLKRGGIHKDPPLYYEVRSEAVYKMLNQKQRALEKLSAKCNLIEFWKNSTLGAGKADNPPGPGFEDNPPGPDVGDKPPGPDVGDKPPGPKVENPPGLGDLVVPGIGDLAIPKVGNPKLPGSEDSQTPGSGVNGGRGMVVRKPKVLRPLPPP